VAGTGGTQGPRDDDESLKLRTAEFEADIYSLGGFHHCPSELFRMVQAELLHRRTRAPGGRIPSCGLGAASP
jgi:hypothetical protein